MSMMLLVVLIDLIGFGIMIPLLPYYAQLYGATPFQVTLLLSTFSGLQFISAPLWGRLSDRIGRKPVVLVSLATSVVAYLWVGHASALWMLFAARALQGVSAGNISVTQAYIADVTTRETRARGMGMMGAAFGVGFTLGPPIGGLLAGASPTAFSAAYPSYFAAALSAVAFVLAVFMLKESLSKSLQAQAAHKTSRFAIIADALSRPRLRLLMLLFFTSTAAFAAMETIFVVWARARFDWGPDKVGYTFFGIGLVLILVQGGLVRVAVKRLGEARMLLVGTVAMAASLALLAISFDPALAIVGCGLMALGMGLSQPGISSLVSFEGAAAEQGGILGINQSVGSIARVVGPAIGGLSFEHLGQNAPYVLGSLAMCWATALAVRAVNQRRGDVPAPVQNAA